MQTGLEMACVMIKTILNHAIMMEMIAVWLGYMMIFATYVFAMKMELNIPMPII